MFAIIETGGKQFKVEKGTTLTVEKLENKEGSTVKIDRVLLINDGATLKVGTPLVEGASVTAKIISQEKADKVTIYKMKAKKRFRKTVGHRQPISKIEITEIIDT